MTVLQAEEFPLPNHVPAVMGQWSNVIVEEGDNLVKISRKYGVSIHNILLHNPSLKGKKYLSLGEKVVVPTCFWVPHEILPGEILVNIATQTLFYRSPNTDTLSIYPVTVGTEENPTPVGSFYVRKKAENPIWYPPQSVRAAAAKRGVSYPFAVEGGDNNPLGAYAMYLNKPTYLIHTALNGRALGGRQSFGCVRMYKGDIKDLYPRIAIKTPVEIVNIPNPDEDHMFNNCAKTL
jgi:L,D-transpeptidase ErfK/SrfK